MRESATTEKPPEAAARKVLVVDDDRVNTRILCAILGTEGYIWAEAGSGEEALAVYPAFQPDLVLLDVVMAGINGFETCRRLKADYGDRAAPVIFITAKSESNAVVEGIEAGGVDYLPKPFKSQEVLARIRSHMQNRILWEQRKALVEQLRKADKAKNRFLGMAAHDLRNPLASIRGIAEFLTEGRVGPLTADQLDLIETIRGASQSMLEMVNELLDVATIEANGLKLNLELENLGKLISNCVNMSNREAIKKNTRITFGPPAEPVMLQIDPGKIKQVAENLLSNAVKYSPSGSDIYVSVTRNVDDTCGFFVRDQGPGIPADERDKLFKDFSRLSIQPTGGEKSTGLGLAICRAIVEAHRGTIVADNLPGLGCEFRVSLPARL